MGGRCAAAGLGVTCTQGVVEGVGVERASFGHAGARLVFGSAAKDGGGRELWGRPDIVRAPGWNSKIRTYVRNPNDEIRMTFRLRSGRGLNDETREAEPAAAWRFLLGRVL
jgi:hypothetical protein